jgi:hypothetical protein
MAATRSAAQRRERIRTEIVTPTGFDEAMVERLAKTDPDVCAPPAEAHFGEGARRIAESLDLAITSVVATSTITKESCNDCPDPECLPAQSNDRRASRDDARRNCGVSKIQS